MQKILPKMYVSKSEAAEMLKEARAAAEAALNAKFDRWRSLLAEQARSQDELERSRDVKDTQLRNSCQRLREELKVCRNIIWAIYVYLRVSIVSSRMACSQ